MHFLKYIQFIHYTKLNIYIHPELTSKTIKKKKKKYTAAITVIHILYEFVYWVIDE